MKAVRTIVLGVAGAVLGAASAAAAEPAGPPMMAPPMLGAAHSWTGAYVGVYGGVLAPILTGPELGIQAGYNFQRGRMVFGGEIEVGAWVAAWTTYLFEGNLNAHAGAVLGERAMVYGEAGVGIWLAVPTWNIGGGAEFAINHRLSVFGEVKAVMVFGGGYLGTQLRVGLNFHP